MESDQYFVETGSILLLNPAYCFFKLEKESSKNLFDQ